MNEDIPKYIPNHTRRSGRYSSNRSRNVNVNGNCKRNSNGDGNGNGDGKGEGKGDGRGEGNGKGDGNVTSRARHRSARILLRPEWRLHLAHLGSIFYQSHLVDHLYLLIDDRSPHLTLEVIQFFIEDLNWLGLPNITIVRISDYYDLLFHCAYWFIDHGETHIEKVITTHRPRDTDYTPTNDLDATTATTATTGTETESSLSSDQSDGSEEEPRAHPSPSSPPSPPSPPSPRTGTRKYFLRESEMHKVKFYFNLDNVVKEPKADDVSISLNKLSSHSKLRIRTNATNSSPSTVLMNYYLSEGICDFNLSFCLPVIDSFLGISTILEQGNGNNHCVIGEDTHNFNRRIFALLNKPYPIYERHPGYKLQNYRYHSDMLSKLITNGILEGFDDPRLLSVRNIRKRGFPAGILREFAAIGVHRGTIDPQQLPDISKTFFINKVLPKYSGIIEPVRIILTNFPNRLTRYYSSHFCTEILALRKLFWIDRAEANELHSHCWDVAKRNRSEGTPHLPPTRRPHPQVPPFMLKGTNTYVQLNERIPMNDAGRNIWKQDHTNTYWTGTIVTRVEGLTFPQNLPWLSCDPVESPFKVRFHFYPEFYTGGPTLPKCTKVLNGLLNERPAKAGVVVIHGYGFFHYDGEESLHLMYAFPKSRCFFN